ncbi:hypothetical protein Dsin_027499 [Dipteronia sinensis]|uniref:Protein ECERIFERUM 26-like n=1 Tax=Dipteronia sinensis TaxID=43782 RepID=A0AAD9ZNW1_9ROSI|nr:hypothetical protein Dsin_027499 [Dipteronia sinensis]
MVSSKEDMLIHNLKLSSVGPSSATGSGVVHEPSGMDLAMKLHYFIGVYLFRRDAAEGLTTMVIKESMFYLLNEYYVICGRFRRSDSGRVYMKCNDCGARFIEAECEKTVDEWLEMRDYSLNKQLVYHLPIGPEISYSPPVFLQVTKFKCGGMSLGLSWAHILGDAFSACEFINMWGQAISKIQADRPPILPRPSPPNFNIPKPQTPPPAHTKPNYPLSIHRVDPVGDLWVPSNNFKMNTFSFHLTSTQMTHLQSKCDPTPIPPFESLCAVVWKCIAKIRDHAESPNIVTLFKRDPNNPKSEKLGITGMISTVEAEFSVADADLGKLGKFLAEEGSNERREIEEAVEKDNGVSDFMVYGANLTFVNMEEAELYGVEVKGYGAELVWYGIEGVGDKGAVVVMKDRNCGKGRVVTVIFSEDEVVKLKHELRDGGLLLDKDIE